MFNVGIIGYGKIGKIRHKILSKIKYVNIISICEENLDKKIMIIFFLLIRHQRS